MAIEKNLSDKWIDNLTRLIEENNAFFEKTSQRIVSYRDCYYRREFYIRETYVGFRILKKLEEKKSNRVKFAVT